MSDEMKTTTLFLPCTKPSGASIDWLTRQMLRDIPADMPLKTYLSASEAFKAAPLVDNYPGTGRGKALLEFTFRQPISVLVDRDSVVIRSPGFFLGCGENIYKIRLVMGDPASKTD